MRKIFFFLAVVLPLVFSDCYLHMPRGSNNRCRERSTNTDNQNRLFSSENNAKGGYCWGPALTYYEGSLLQVEWTSQHGCGAGSENVDCDLILQYMCHPTVRDGIVTDRISKDTVDETTTDPVTGQNVFKYGMHEPYDNLDKCQQRIYNRGLFIADQGLQQTSTALRTRQDNQEGNPHGFECEEERDYYPYWHPSYWRDIAILTSNTARCNYFRAHSQNVEPKFECSVYKHNNQDDCVADGGQWTSQKAWNIPAPACVENGYSRDNHLGNSKTGFTNTYDWEIPFLNTMDNEYKNSDGTANCVFRIRYNITTGDYAGWGNVDKGSEMIDAKYNDEASPIRQDPYITYGTDADGNDKPLRLAMNTDQLARTFQDRSHMFHIASRPSDVTATHRIINLGVRGKRGNIVETFPATEYDFTPTNLNVFVGDFLHIQWTGCDFNPNYAGEGKQGTDRSNICQINDRRENKCLDFGKQSLFPSSTAYYLAHLNQFDGKVCKTDGETGCCKTLEQLKNAGGNINENDQNCMKLNAPVAYANAGLVRMSQAGSYDYMSTRNNNFSNRSQKGTINVEALIGTFGIVIAAVGAAGFIGAATVAGLIYYAHTHPAGCVANLVSGVKV